MVSKVIEAGIFFTETSRPIGNCMVCIHTLFTNLTVLRHTCGGVCSTTVTYDWFPVIFSEK